MKRISEIIPNSVPGNFTSYLKNKRMWADCAGDTIAIITTPGSLKDGVLNMAVHDQTWVSELGFFKGELINRLREAGMQVENINFYYKPRKPEQTLQEFQKKKMTPKEKDFADRLIATIEKDDLRESFKKAIYSYFTAYTLDDYLNC